MKPIFSFTHKGKKYSFVNHYDNHNSPLKGNYVTFPLRSGMRSNCANRECDSCLFTGTDCYEILLPYNKKMQAKIPQHIKNKFPELFI